MYLIDTNIFIEAKNRYYAFDIAPGFWDWLDKAKTAKTVCSIDQVKAEMTAGSDPLSAWARDQSGFFQPMDEAAVERLPQVAAWATSQSFTNAAISEFFSVADFYLVAYALAHGHTIVTHEMSNPKAKARVMIPDACIALGVPYCSPFTMLRKETAALVLECPAA